MTLSLRRLARSRRFPAMSVLVWLMLVVNAVAAAPLGMHAMAGADAMEATSAVIDAHCHDAASMPRAAGNNAGCADRTDCCGGMAGNQCTCAAMCAAALAPIMAVAIGPMAFAAIYATPRLLDAPALAAAPPLRPPAV